MAELQKMNTKSMTSELARWNNQRVAILKQLVSAHDEL
jgi:hypothetical protein